MVFFGTQGQVTMKSPIWPEFEQIRDCTADLVTCKFEDDSIKSEGASLQTIFSPLYRSAQEKSSFFTFCRGTPLAQNVFFFAEKNKNHFFCRGLSLRKFASEGTIIRTTFLPLQVYGGYLQIKIRNEIL